MPLPSVLIVDDEQAIRENLADILEGHAARIRCCGSVHDALSCLSGESFDVVISDVHMPGASGLDLIRNLQHQQRGLGFIFISGNPAVPELVAALRCHAADFLTKPFSGAQLREAVAETYRTVTERRQDSDKIRALSLEIRAQSRQLRDALSAVQLSQKAHLEALIVALDAREHETCAHCFRVRAYTSRLAVSAQYACTSFEELEMAALLHDIGKIAIPDSILLKPGRLTLAEAEFCKRHSLVGSDILDSIPSFCAIARIVRHHHEKWDGSGYPDHLKGEAIPLGSRLFAIADTLDALTSDRCYRKAISLASARQEILRCRGTQFDPILTDLFAQVPDEEWQQLRAQAEQALSSRHANVTRTFGAIVKTVLDQSEMEHGERSPYVASSDSSRAFALGR